MKSSASQRVLAVICLAAVCLGQTVFGAFRVKCEDASGRARFEAACVRWADGSCASGCAAGDPAGVAACEEDGEHEPHPCTDTPMGESLNAARHHSPIDPFPMHFELAAAIAALPLVVDEPVSPASSRLAWVEDRPSDAVERIRTVILLV